MQYDKMLIPKKLSKAKAIAILASWYNGQWSAMYQYLSSGEYVADHAVQYITEVTTNLTDQVKDYNFKCTHNKTLHYTKQQLHEQRKDINNLASLLDYFNALIVNNHLN